MGQFSSRTEVAPPVPEHAMTDAPQAVAGGTTVQPGSYKIEPIKQSSGNLTDFHVTRTYNGKPAETISEAEKNAQLAVQQSRIEKPIQYPKEPIYTMIPTKPPSEPAPQALETAKPRTIDV